MVESPTHHSPLKTSPIDALFNGEVQGIVAACYENERPLAGLLGVVDWHFHGLISKAVKSGAITGKAGECVYFPVKKNDRVYHIILAGAGRTALPGERTQIPEETLELLKKNLIQMKLPKVGISRLDFGNVTPEFLDKNLEGAPLWIAP